MPHVVVVGLLKLLFSISLLVLVFSGELSEFAAQEMGLALLGTAV